MSKPKSRTPDSSGRGAAVAGSAPERTPVVVSQQIWWLAGAFWGGVVFLMRRWLD